MRILFVNYVNFLESALPEGVALLITILKNQGHQVELFDTTFLKTRAEAKPGKKKPKQMVLYKTTACDLESLVADDPEVDIKAEFLKVVDRFKPSLIAVSAMTTNYEKSLELIKGSGLRAKVIFGGVHPTLMPEDVIREKNVDFICVGEGEDALPELCAYMEGKGDYGSIKNLYFKESSGKIRENSLRPFVSLDSLPVLNLDLFDDRHFFRPFMGNIYKGIFISTSRGCPRGCAYCVNNRLRSIFKECGRSYIRFQSPNIVARNLRYLKEKYGITWIKFSDDTFLMRPLKDLYEIRDLIKPLNIMFGCSVDPGTVLDEKVKIAKEMGCVAMSIGVETGNEKIRKYVLGRNISNEQIKRAVDTVKKHGIKISTFNMVGLPGETKKNVFETIRLNKDLGVPD
ncbi:MAG TPA: radical SAM protein, partial [Candidatus Omnitrophota bacterium]|nr:radical SAM protein [Candidatus Omnitrophota bacterium]